MLLVLMHTRNHTGVDLTRSSVVLIQAYPRSAPSLLILEATCIALHLVTSFQDAKDGLGCPVEPEGRAISRSLTISSSTMQVLDMLEES